MRHKVFGRKLNRDVDDRLSLYRNLARSLILNGKITVTLAKAKAVQPLIEEVVNRSKVNDLTTRRILLKKIVDTRAVEKLLKEIGPKFKNRQGGYTRIIKTSPRLGDNSRMSIITFTENVANSELKTVSKEVKKTKEVKEGKEKSAKNKTNKTK